MNNFIRIVVLSIVLVNINANAIDNKIEGGAVVVISDQVQNNDKNAIDNKVEKEEVVVISNQTQNNDKTDLRSNKVLTVNLVENNLVISFTNSTEIQEKLTKLNINAQLNVGIGGERKGPGSVSVNSIEDKTPEQTGSLVWKTIKNKKEIVYEEMIMGTYEQNTANDYMIQTFFGRMVFKDNFKLMAKVLPCNIMKFFSTLGLNKTPENFNFIYKYGVESNGTYHELDHFEILTNPNKVQYKWVKSEVVPANAVICSEELDKNYYCGRMHVLDRGLMPAKIADGVAYAHFYEVRSSTDFEYLVE